MRIARLTAVVLVTLALAGCDTTDFTEDYPDPGTHGLPPAVWFAHTSLPSPTWTHNPNAPQQGSVRNISPTATEANRTSTILTRLPVALEEDVTVSYVVRGTAVAGVDYEITVQNPPNWIVDQDTGQPSWSYVDVGYSPPQNNQFVIGYRVEDGNTYYRNFRVTILPTATPGRYVQVELVDATAPSGRTINVGRLPANRDKIITINII